MRIGELSKRSGLSRDTLRFYEREGLIRSEPSQSGSNSYRNYPDDLLERLEMIAEAQAAGLPLGDLRILLDAMESGVESDFDVDWFLADRIRSVQDTIKNARKFLKTLRETRAALAAAVTDSPPNSP